MRKGTDILNRSIIAFDTGRRIARVLDLIFDQDTNQLLGFLVDEGGLFHSAKVIPLNQVKAIGPDVIVVPGEDSIVPVKDIPQIQTVVEHKLVLKGNRILTTDGRYLGSIVDLYFNEQTGNIEGYETSGGLFADTYSGRSFIPAPQTVKIGEEVTFVPPETADLMEEQIGGIRGAMITAGSQIQQSTAVAGQKLQDVTLAANDKLQSANDSATRKLQAATNGASDRFDQGSRGAATAFSKLQGVAQSGNAALFNTVARAGIEQASGRRAQHMVRGEDGMIIAAPGQIVTDIVITRAKMSNREAALLDAVGLQPAEATRYRAKEAVSDTGMRVREQAAIAQENAYTFWEDLKTQYSELKRRSARAMHQRRIEQALGRPVNRVILDLQDNVILNVGELITHEAIRLAEQGGILNILLNSVYIKNPVISEAQLRAPERGMASLEREHDLTPQHELAPQPQLAPH